MRRKLLISVQAVCLLMVLAFLYVGRDQIARLPPPTFLRGSKSTVGSVPTVNSTLTNENLAAYVIAIMNPNATELPRLECPAPDMARYSYLKGGSASDPEIKYFFAIDLRECLPLLPRLLGSVVEVIRLLGPPHCVLSIVEGNSADGTAEVLAALRPELDALATTYHFLSSDVDPRKGDRIAALAELRNLALAPMLDGFENYDNNPSSSSRRYSANTTVIFLNDVAACPEDILELVHQRAFLTADVTCAMDWTYVGRDPTFYDVWVARAINGDSFFEIPADGSWNSAWNLFWNEPIARARWQAHRPFQVFSCWNGAAVFGAEPLLTRKVAFRSAGKDECFQGEPQLFCKDMWRHGYGKIVVVPSVNLEYSDKRARQIKELKGYVSRWVGAEHEVDDRFEWRSEPPEKVKCMAGYDRQVWLAWNESLT